MFLLPSLPFGSASGGKTQPLLHPSPAERDERGGIMQSSWPALPAPAGTAHPTTNTPELLRRSGRGRQLPALCGGSAGPARTGEGGAAPAPAPCPDPRPLCLHPLSLPSAAGGWASPGICSIQPCPLQEGMGSWREVLQLWLLPWLSPPPSRGCVFALELPVPSVPAGKTLGRDTGRYCPSPPLAAAGEGALACPHQAAATAGGTLPHNGAPHSAHLLVNKCTGLPQPTPTTAGGWGGPTPTCGA